jgi:transposase-like protein
MFREPISVLCCFFDKSVVYVLLDVLWYIQKYFASLSCEDTDRPKYGQTVTGRQRYRCPSCKRYFQTGLTYKAYKPGLKAEIWELTYDGRGTARLLGI